MVINHQNCIQVKTITYWEKYNCIVLVENLEVFRKLNNLYPLWFGNMVLVMYYVIKSLDLNTKIPNAALFIKAKIRK